MKQSQMAKWWVSLQPRDIVIRKRHQKPIVLKFWSRGCWTNAAFHNGQGKRPNLFGKQCVGTTDKKSWRYPMNHRDIEQCRYWWDLPETQGRNESTILSNHNPQHQEGGSGTQELKLQEPDLGAAGKAGKCQSFFFFQYVFCPAGKCKVPKRSKKIQKDPKSGCWLDQRGWIGTDIVGWQLYGLPRPYWPSRTSCWSRINRTVFDADVATLIRTFGCWFQWRWFDSTVSDLETTHQKLEKIMPNSGIGPASRKCRSAKYHCTNLLKSCFW